jgi:hypothetical protein
MDQTTETLFSLLLGIESIEWKQMFLFLFATSARFARNTMTYLGLFLRQCGLFTKLPDAVGPNFK